MPKPKKDGKFINVKITKAVVDQLNAHVLATRLSKTDVVELALIEYLDNHKPQN